MASKTGISSLSQGRSDLLKINPYDLHIKQGWNTRDMNDPSNVEHIDMLAKSIAEIGVKVPLKAYWDDGKAYVTSGHCRHAAAIRAIEVYKADLKTVPVQIEDRYSGEADRLLGQIVDNQGKPFSPLEQAKVFKKLLDLGWQQGDIAKKAGLSAGRVSQLLDMLTMPEGVKAMVTAGNVSATLAVQTVKDAPTASAAEKTLKAALETAKAEGKNVVKPNHISNEPKVNLKKLVREALQSSDIDDGSEIVVVRMSEEDYSAILEAIGGLD